jgi:hypothetical protein
VNFNEVKRRGTRSVSECYGWVAACVISLGGPPADRRWGKSRCDVIPERGRLSGGWIGRLVHLDHSLIWAVGFQAVIAGNGGRVTIIVLGAWIPRDLVPAKHSRAVPESSVAALVHFDRYFAHHGPVVAKSLRRIRKTDPTCN